MINQHIKLYLNFLTIFLVSVMYLCREEILQLFTRTNETFSIHECKMILLSNDALLKQKIYVSFGGKV